MSDDTILDIRPKDEQVLDLIIDMVDLPNITHLNALSAHGSHRTMLEFYIDNLRINYPYGGQYIYAANNTDLRGGITIYKESCSNKDKFSKAQSKLHGLRIINKRKE